MGPVEATPIRLPKAAVMVASSLRKQIVRGDLQEGQALPNEGELMDLYQVARPTVREALRILESESLISVKRGAGGGARVRQPDARSAARYVAVLMQVERTTLADLFQARSFLEVNAVRTLDGKPPRAALSRLRKIHEQELELVDQPAAFASRAAEFHEQVISLSGSKSLTVLARMLHEIVEAHNQAAFDAVGSRAAAVARFGSKPHGELIDLIEAGEYDRAAELWADHMAAGCAFALKKLGARTIVDLLDERD
jgi:DNA-binding FadR family transcriptional regulator